MGLPGAMSINLESGSGVTGKGHLVGQAADRVPHPLRFLQRVRILSRTYDQLNRLAQKSYLVQFRAHRRPPKRQRQRTHDRSPNVTEINNMTSNMTSLEVAMSPELN